MQRERVCPGEVSLLYRQRRKRSGNGMGKVESAERGVLALTITDEVLTTYELLTQGLLRRTEAFR